MLFVSRHSLETMLPCCHAAMLPCCHAAMLPCCYAAMLPCCHAAMLPCCHAAMLPCCHAAMLPCCHAAMLPCCHAAMLPCCHAAMLPCCHAAMLPCCYAAMLPCCHAATCKQGGDVVARHNHYCCHAHQVVISLDHSHGCLADILALDWDRGKHAAFDITVTSPLSATIHPEAARSVCGGGGGGGACCHCQKGSSGQAEWVMALFY